MSWKDIVTGPATFRGAAFFVDLSEHSGGRKAIIHEYPYRDLDFVEDLGRLGRSFQIDGYLLGEDYLTARNALLDALNAPGPGSLVHPYYGTILVSSGGYRAREIRDEGGYVLVSMEFHETAASAFSPIASAAPLGQVNASADNALTATQNGFFKNYALSLPASGVGAVLPGSPTKPLSSFSFASVAGVVTGFSSKLRDTMAPVIRDTQALAGFKSQIDALITDATSLVRDPLALAARVRDVAATLITLPATPRLGVRALLAAYGFVSDADRPESPITATRTAEQSNYDATDAMLRAVLAVEAARAAVFAASATDSTPAGLNITVQPDADAAFGRAVFDSYEDAIETRDAVTDALDVAADNANDDEAYGAILDLRAEVVQSVPGENSRLPHLITVTPPETIPTLVLLYSLYGSLDLESDLVTRNHVRRPGFVPGARAIQVLSRG